MADDAAAIAATIHQLVQDDLRVPDCRNMLATCMSSAATESLRTSDALALRYGGLDSARPID